MPMKSFRIIPIVFLFVASVMTHAETTSPSPTAPEAPPGVDPKLTSTNPEYGYSKDNPIKVESSSAQLLYLSKLRDEAGKPLRFKRAGSVGAGADDHVIDRYDVETSAGRKFMLYLDMYHPESAGEKQLAPSGLFKRN